MERKDLVIIGSGPAGLSAALTAKNRNLDFLIFGSGRVSEKVTKAHRITNYLGLTDVSGEELSAAFQSQMEHEGISIRSERIGTVYAMGDYLSLQVGQEMIETRSVILATGAAVGKPYPGEDELLGHGVSYCATCDGNFYRNRPVAVIGGSREEEPEVMFLADICSEVLYFPLYDEIGSLPEQVKILRKKPKEIRRNTGADVQEGRVLLETDGGTYASDCIFVLRAAVAPDKLVPGLAAEKGHVTVDRKMATNLPGVYAAGDLTGAPYQYMKSAGEGNVAAVSAALYVQEVKKKEKEAQA